MPKLLPQRLAVAVQVSRHVEMDGLSDQGASEPEAKCPRGAQQRSRHVRDGLPEGGASEHVA